MRPRRAPSAAYSHRYEREFADILCTMDKELTQTYERADGPMGLPFMTEQMNVRKGLKRFGQAGAEAVAAELRQLDYRRIIKPKMPKELTREDKKKCLNYLMYLKEKRCGRIKARGCADG